MFSFTLNHSYKSARCGVIHTQHGDINTPSFVPVGTQGSIKSLTSSEIKDLKVQLFFINTYHMMLRPGVTVMKKFGGLHQFINWNGPLITDSGGFQVFSLAKNKYREDSNQPSLVKIDDDGVTFRSHWDGSLHRLDPKKSMEIQQILGADINIAFDDCTPFPVTEADAQESLQRTHRWALTSWETHVKLQQNTKEKTALYGSIQGSVYRSLRIESAKFISSLPFSGFAIGGVAVGESKTETEKILSWVTPFLPPDKPRHLLGVGEIDDIFTLVRYGIDTFDCVMPTRLARMGQLLTKVKSKKLKVKSEWKIDITKKTYSLDKQPIETDCQCYTCLNHSRAYLHHLFKVRELLAYHLATIHNLYFIENLLQKIRTAIKEGTLEKIEKEYLS